MSNIVKVIIFDIRGQKLFSIYNLQIWYARPVSDSEPLQTFTFDLVSQKNEKRNVNINFPQTQLILLKLCSLKYSDQNL